MSARPGLPCSSCHQPSSPRPAWPPVPHHHISPPLPKCRACSELDKLCEFFHIPFQSGDNDILREMKRGVGGWRGGDPLLCCTALFSLSPRLPHHVPPSPPLSLRCLPTVLPVYCCWRCRRRRLHARAVPRDHPLHPALYARRLGQRRRHRGVPRGDGGAVCRHHGAGGGGGLRQGQHRCVHACVRGRCVSAGVVLGRPARSTQPSAPTASPPAPSCSRCPPVQLHTRRAPARPPPCGSTRWPTWSRPTACSASTPW